MSQQLTLSSLFCALALASLCVVSAARDLSVTHTAAITDRAELVSGPIRG